MKKALCIISVLLCILLTACGNDSSIGIIGGADGPTAVFVTASVGSAWQMFGMILLLAVGILGYLKLSRFGKK